MTDMDQLDENLKAMADAFGDTDRKTARDAPAADRRRSYCRMCGECDGQCRQGLPVADVLRFLTYADGYGQFGLARERFQELDAAHAAVQVRRLPGLHGPMPLRGEGDRPADPRAGAVRMLIRALGLALAAAGLAAAPAPTCGLVGGWSPARGRPQLHGR